MNIKKTFFLEIFGLLLFVIITILVLEFIFRNEKTNIDTLFEKIKHGQNIELIIVGNSHSGALGNPSYTDIEKTNIANLSIGGQDIFHSFQIIKKSVNSLPNLKCIILSIDYDLLGYSLISTNQDYTARQYYIHTDTLENMSITNVWIAKSNFFRANRDFSLLFNRNQKINNNNKPELKENFTPLTINNINENEFCKKRATEMTSIKFSKNLIEKNFKTIVDIINITNLNNVNLIVLVPPKRDCFYQHANQENTILGKETLYSILSNNNCTFIDLYENPSFQDDDFVDPDHLNQKGGDFLNGILDEQIRNLQIKSSFN